jgi:multidrug transporter EmrE-like cation transporter
MSNQLNQLPLILLGVFLNAASQLLLKHGMNRIGYFSFSWDNLWPISQQIIINPFILTAIACYGFSVIVWMLVLSRSEVSYAYPMLSVGYLIVAVSSYFLFQEALTVTRVAGIIVIIFGVYLLNMNAT